MSRWQLNVNLYQSTLFTHTIAPHLSYTIRDVAPCMFKLGFSTKPLTLKQRAHVYHNPQHHQQAKFRFIIKGHIMY